MVHCRDQVRSHFQDKHRQRQDGGQPQVTFQGGLFGLLALFQLLLHGGAVAGLARRIAGTRDGIDQGLHIGTAVHGGALGRQVDAGAADTGHLLQRPLDTRHAGGTGHFLDRELNSLLRHGIAGLFDCGNQAGAISTVHRDIGAFGRQVDGGIADAGDFLQGAFDPAYTGGAGHALYGQADLVGWHVLVLFAVWCSSSSTHSAS